ncbi:MAG: PIN domain-containing protein [Acetobacteraceae bacterium]
MKTILKIFSTVTWMEVLAGAPPDTEAATRAFLAAFTRVALDEPVAKRAGAIHRTQRIKLPDAIVRASAETQDRLLITRDERAFAGDDPRIRVPYRL